jgi:hypothetical protein
MSEPSRPELNCCRTALLPLSRKVFQEGFANYISRALEAAAGLSAARQKWFSETHWLPPMIIKQINVVMQSPEFFSAHLFGFLC